jgi:hypothetical protein
VRPQITIVNQQPIAEILSDMPIIVLDHLGTGGLIGLHDLTQLFWV